MPNDELSALRLAIHQHYLDDEEAAVARLCARLSRYRPHEVESAAGKLIAAIRGNKEDQSLIAAFLHEYRLDSAEGLVLMSIAEALLRIPDRKTQDLLLQDKLSSHLWRNQGDHSLLISLSNHALQLAGALEQHLRNPGKVYERMLSRLGAPLIRSALKHAMQLMAHQFVIAEDIETALQQTDDHYRYSFDMLGEAALTETDAERYFQAYLKAISALASQSEHDDIIGNPGISIKLSALYPRYEPLQHRKAERQLIDKLFELARLARDANISITIDAEESERLDMSLTIFQALFGHDELQGWQGLGLAVQAYQKRAYALICWLAALAESKQRRIPLRLVKGAYWDSEIKRAQENGLSDYPVFTHKSATDISYLACAELMLANPHAFYSQFATHNAHTVYAISQLAGNTEFEFQRLQGMGQRLYQQLFDSKGQPPYCRVYAPVGDYRDLLPYLVRRLLENGANTSFINQLENPNTAIKTLIQDPVTVYRSQAAKKPAVVLPRDLFGKQRQNSAGLNLADPLQLQSLQQELEMLAQHRWQAAPLINGQAQSGVKYVSYSPANRKTRLGEVTMADHSAIQAALDSAAAAYGEWRLCPVKKRALYLQQAAELLENHHMELASLCIREGGRSVKDALNEVREAVDFCRYYAAIAEDTFGQPILLPGPAGEQNRLLHYGRGVFACISPWNFPIAIFVGQISAALAAGNTVIAKPAQQTSLTAMFCIQLLHQAGIPTQVLQFLPGEGATIGKILLSDPRIAGVAFTGSTATANLINRQLSSLPAIVALIAETGGQNVMIADSSAHCEQLVQDAIVSAFNSAGQRCSALRVLYLQQDIADKVIAMLTGAMKQLVIGDPNDYAVDIGPVIDQQAVDRLEKHVRARREDAEVLYQINLPACCAAGSFFPPTLIELTSLNQLEEEIFGPILHVIRYREGELQQVIEGVNRCGYGLTLGIQSRIQQTIDRIHRQVKVGNVYVNRNMIGAVVGVQPFGGMGLSGTGPKAGGPSYLQRFSVEQTLTVNSTAIGGNVALLSRQLL
ncbi:bifunctional proline dehydrogenase/L-glutamate gamma-semialdehyde dehydrogenase PutA [Methylomarinum sp. Ch1-1]|uniref:Bifunctional protein PutA n=1 Tax=Methylomarinum roseum TaxID=3067653 RepID=A0AAU7NYM1_9GAMM|nr:bifunctional proline dehydrogenase/L-glutamate gamma-semialdehyde dehydrogenase PutA [Methylomarinum sp. Ch1-1]MDP4521841.1 bifunctional proline dehydrogenase/L-glutamate gamma-semialdehyde dehydrogenase PutA [Methylomarinum sp. Ch1-1]